MFWAGTLFGRSVLSHASALTSNNGRRALVRAGASNGNTQTETLAQRAGVRQGTADEHRRHHHCAQPETGVEHWHNQETAAHARSDMREELARNRSSLKCMIEGQRQAIPKLGVLEKVLRDRLAGSPTTLPTGFSIATGFETLDTGPGTAQSRAKRRCISPMINCGCRRKRTRAAAPSTVLSPSPNSNGWSFRGWPAIRREHRPPISSKRSSRWRAKRSSTSNGLAPDFVWRSVLSVGPA